MSTIYEFLRCTKRAISPQPTQNSHWIRTSKVEKRASALSGHSRIHGDASPEVQDRVIDLLLEIGARYKLPYRDIAHLLLICKMESGFNPDTAAPTTSAAGLAQYTDSMIEEVSSASISRTRLGFALDLGPESLFDAERGAYSMLLAYMRAKELAITYFGTEYEKNLYLFHREGWSFKPTPAHLAMGAPTETLRLISTQILPFLDKLELLLSASCTLSFKLLTKDDQPCGRQPFLAIYPMRANGLGMLPQVQGTAQKAKFMFGVTDATGCTPPVRTQGLSEVVFVILNRNYKELLGANASMGSEPLTEYDQDLSTRIASDAALTATGLQKITRISNASCMRTDRQVQPHTGEYLWRRPPMGLVAAYLREAVNTKEDSAPALVEHKRSHIVLPAGNRAQRHGDTGNVVAIRAGTTIGEFSGGETTTEIPHTTTETTIKKKVEVSTTKTGDVLAVGLLFPLPERPQECYRSGIRAFNSSRGKRRHAGCDLYAPVGTEVRAMADGIIIQCYGFYWKTDAIEVLHGDFIVRYGEIEQRNRIEQDKLKKMEVKRGDVIGKVGQLIEPNKSKHPHTMLHLEMYRTNTLPTRPENQLSQKKLVPFERRSDLIDPSDTLDMCVFN